MYQNISLKLVIIFLFCFIFWGVSIANAQVNISVSLSLDNYSLSDGNNEVIQIPLILDSSYSSDIYGIDVLLAYDPQEVSVLDFVPSETTSSAFDYINYNSLNHYLTMVSLSDQGINFNRHIVLGYFEVRPLSSGHINIDFDFEQGSTNDTNVVNGNAVDILTNVNGIEIIQTNYAQEGEFCGGRDNILCERGLICDGLNDNVCLCMDCDCSYPSGICTPEESCIPRPSCLDNVPPCLLSVPPGGWCEYQTCLYDISRDNIVNVEDLIMVLENWGQHNNPADINGDNNVNVLDLILILENWGTCIHNVII